MISFVPFHEIEGKEVIVVDGLHPQLYTLSHWKGANNKPGVAADTSGEIVLNAIEKGTKEVNGKMVTATHFDIDGFVGVFALFYKELAMQFKTVLSAMARIGDFRELRPEAPEDDHALKLCCWMNTVEKEEFYRPFEEKDELKQCVKKFEYFLPLFTDVLLNTNDYKNKWQEEYDKVQQGLKLLQKGSETHFPNLNLIIRKVKEPVHYYALFSETEGFDIVLSIYNNQRYELEYKYTTWVDISSRSTFPRLELKSLVRELNEIEKSGLKWQADQVSDTGPILRLESDSLSKADRYANPYERTIFSSSITETEFIRITTSFFENNLAQVSPKRFWSWKETRLINKKLFQHA